MKVERRPARPRDTGFARRTHRAAYRDVVERQFGPWDAAQQDAFFATSWASFAHEILLVSRRRVGYCAIEHRPDDIHLAELVIDPRHQGRGVGTAVIRQLQAVATRLGKPIRLGTFHQNRAQELYTRLGFVRIGTTPTHIVMEWRPAAPTPRSARRARSVRRR